MILWEYLWSIYNFSTLIFKIIFVFWKLHTCVWLIFNPCPSQKCSQLTETGPKNKRVGFWLVFTVLIGYTTHSRPITGCNTKRLLKVDKHPRDPLILFDLQVNLFMKHLCLNINQIGRAWCQTIGYWGQEMRILHLFQEILSEKSKVLFIKSRITSGNSWQLPIQPVFGGNLVNRWEIQKFYKRCEQKESSTAQNIVTYI